MDFIKRKMSRMGSQLVHHKVVIKMLHLEVIIEYKGDVWVQFKRGKHKEQTQRYPVDAGGYGRDKAYVRFNAGEVFTRVADFYKDKNGKMLPKYIKFQIFFQAEGQSTPMKITTAQIDLSHFIGRGHVKDSHKFSQGIDAKCLEFEVLVEEGGSNLAGKQEESSDDEEEV
jgi:hypothetical protein